MTEWGVVSVLVVLVGLIAAIATPLVKVSNKNIRAMTENTMAIGELTRTIERNETRNEEEHVALWEELDKQNDTVQDHETRLTVIEKGGDK